ncbi:gelsolin-related protein of 125 kDa-like isoform X2 [Entelurus aequoreus]|uniref:gelsolin-related protein of 125 kDa-like isoform X2 n=1 Tax=Entelurus aequoreus TaxID=161455 RepID=UPI002B1E8C1C|nr:gelsolin-related protein of 125 kDa-like isoform X2 [Entelurus aequoreus]
MGKKKNTEAAADLRRKSLRLSDKETQPPKPEPTKKVPKTKKVKGPAKDKTEETKEEPQDEKTEAPVEDGKDKDEEVGAENGEEDKDEEKASE